jgi:sugar transferase EpsL
MSFYKGFGKRAFDLAAASAALLVLAPVLVVVAIAVAFRLGTPVLFSQQRTGHQRRPFFIKKFRSMTDECDERGQPLPDERRLTPFGIALRSTSLDELPALLNIIRGEMSIVGPRPFHHRYLARYNEEQLRRFEVRPGLTGWSMVNGRNALTWEEKFALDIWYVDRVSFLLDLKIIFMTIAKVLKREGINSDEHATMPEFLGNKPNPAHSEMPPAAR